MTAHIVVRELGEAPATMSREILHELLREELGFDGLVMTDALEMRAIADTVGVEEGAVRAIEAGADALCLGHDLFEDSVRRVRDALVEAVRSGRLQEARLVDAAGRVRRASAWVSESAEVASAARVTSAWLPRDVRSRRTVSDRWYAHRSSSSSSPSRAWPPGACRKAPATGFGPWCPSRRSYVCSRARPARRSRSPTAANS